MDMYAQAVEPVSYTHLESHQWENTVGFYLENEDEEAFPLGNPEERLRKVV